MAAAAVSAPEDGTLTVSCRRGSRRFRYGIGRPGRYGCCRWFQANDVDLQLHRSGGTIAYPREIRVTVPASWYNENEDDARPRALTPLHSPIKMVELVLNVVEELAAVGMDLVVRVRAGSATLTRCWRCG